MERILVSACLMGLTVRYNGSDKLLISRTLLRQHGIEVFSCANSFSVSRQPINDAWSRPDDVLTLRPGAPDGAPVLPHSSGSDDSA